MLPFLQNVLLIIKESAIVQFQRKCLLSLYHQSIRQTRFFTFCGPIEGKSCGIGATLSSTPFLEQSVIPFRHSWANLSTLRLAQLVDVHNMPPFFTRGHANFTNSSISFFTLHRFFFFPTLVDGGSNMTMSNFSPLFDNRDSQSKPATQM